MRKIGVLCALLSVLPFVRAETPARSPESMGIPSAAIADWLSYLEKAGTAPRAFVIRRHGKIVSCGGWKPCGDNENREVFGLTRLLIKTAAGMAVADGKLPDDERTRTLLRRMEADDPQGEAAADALSARVHKAVNLRLSTYLHERLFLRLDGACYDWSCGPAKDRREVCGFAGWFVRPTQLSKIVQIFQNGGEFLGRRYFTEAWTRANDVRVMAYDGQVLVADRKRDAIVVVLTDSTDHRSVLKSIRERLLPSFADTALPESQTVGGRTVSCDPRHAVEAIRSGATDWSVAQTNLLRSNCAASQRPAPASRVVWPKPDPGRSFGDEHVIFERRPDRKTGIARNSEGDMIQLKDGSLLLAWTQMTGGWGSDFGDGRLMKCVSRDGGLTWGKDEVLFNPPKGAFSLMEVSFLPLKSGRIGLVYGAKMLKNGNIVMPFFFRSSADEGRTWSDAVRIQEPGKNLFWGICHQRLIQLSSGRLLFPSAENRSLLVWRSDDEGKTWQRSAQVPNRDQNGEPNACEEPGVVELKDGRILYYCRTYRDYQYFSYSSDGGVTWSEFKPSTMCSPGAPATIWRLSDDRLYAVWPNLENHPEAFFETPSCNGARSPLVFAVSDDEGENWRTLLTLETRGHSAYSFLREYGGYVYLGYGTPDLMTLRVIRFPFADVRGK